MEDVAEDEDESSSSEEEEEEAPRPKRKSTGRTPKPRKIRVSAGQPKKKTASPKARGAAPTAKTVQTSLISMLKKILVQEETTENSLLAAVLDVYENMAGKKRRFGDTTTFKSMADIAHHVIEQHEADPNKCHADLFNFLFRCTGGGYDCLIDASEVDLENISDEEYEDIITAVTEGMQNAADEDVLVCADPLGSIHARNGSGKGKNTYALAEFRKIYEEFWHTLGTVALSSSSQQAEDGSDDNEEGFTTSRFQVEVTRDILCKMIEMVGVGQPDIRAAATIAVYQLSTAMLERSVELSSKVDVAARQLSAAKRSKSSRKSDVLQVQISSWRRTIDDLEDLVIDTVMKAVFTKRYCDTNAHIRALSMDTVSRFSLIRPDKFLKGTYLKYLGWMLSDKEAVVRASAIEGLTAPFKEASTASRKTGASRIDLNAMTPVIEKFLLRLAECARDVDQTVQEKATELLLILIRGGRLDSIQSEDDVWNQINARSLAHDATPTARRNALYFVLEQLEAFDSGNATSESKAAERIDNIADW